MEEKKDYTRIFLIIGNLILWTLILIIWFIYNGVVNAAPIDYDSTGNYIHKNTPSEEWINFPRATDYSLNSLATYSQVNIQWQNYQQGVANGIAQLKIVSDTLDSFTCNELYSKFRVLENGTNTNANITRNECSINTTTHEVRLKIGFVTSVLGTNSYLEIQFLQPFGLATSINALGVMTVNSLDPATNTDIQDQTNALIQNNNENTTNIINNMSLMQEFLGTKIQESQNICNEYNNINGPLGEQGKYLKSNGTTYNYVNWNITDYIKVNQNKTYILTTNYDISNSVYYCFYNQNKDLLNCNNMSGGRITTMIAQQNGYIRYSYSTYSTRTNTFTGQYCQDRTQALIEENSLLYQWMYTREEPDDTEFENTHDKEMEILDMAEEIDLNDVEVNLDTNTGNWVWTTLTSLLTSNNLIMSMVISILSIGVIKLLLNR